MMRKIFGCLLVCSACAITLSACSAWVESDDAAFARSCSENARQWCSDTAKARQYCDCVTAAVKTKYNTPNAALEHVEQIYTDSFVTSCRTEVFGK
jgi:DNA-binding transcriptional regulator YbjK